MDEETRAAFARIDRWFELGQVRHVDLVDEMNRPFDDVNGRFDDINGRFHDINGRFDDVNGRFVSLEGQVRGLRHEFHQFRDWTALQVTELRSAFHQFVADSKRTT